MSKKNLLAKWRFTAHGNRIHHFQQPVVPFRKKKFAVIFSTMLACATKSPLAVAQYLYDSGVHSIDTDDSGFIPMTAPAGYCASGFSNCTLFVTGGATVTFTGSNFQLLETGSRLPIALGGDNQTSFLTIRGTTANKALISGGSGNAIVINKAAKSELTLDKVSIQQPGNNNSGVGIFANGVSASVMPTIKIIDSEITYNGGLYGIFSQFTLENTKISSKDSAITLSQLSELDGIGLVINSSGGHGINGTADGIGASSTFKKIRLIDSIISTTGNYAGIFLAAQTSPITQLIDRLYLDKVTINTAGSNAYGLRSYFSTGTIENSKIDTLGAGAHGIWLEINGGLDLYNTVVSTAGSSAYGVYAMMNYTSGTGGTDFGPIVLSLNDSHILTTNQLAHAVVASGGRAGYGNATVNYQGGTIETRGNNAHALYANAGANVVANDVVGRTSGSNAYAVISTGYTAFGASDLKLNRADLSTTGVNSSLLNVANGGVLTGQNVAGWTRGVNASTLMLRGINSSSTPVLNPAANNYTNTATLINSILKSDQGQGIGVNGGARSLITLTDTDIYGGMNLAEADRLSFVADVQDVYYTANGNYLGSFLAKDINLFATGSVLSGGVLIDNQSEVTQFDFTHSALHGNISLRNNAQFDTLNLRNASHWHGSALTDANGTHIQHVLVDPTSIWTLTGGNSIVGNLSNPGNIIFKTPGAGGSFQSLRVTGDYTGGGALWMNGLLRSNNADSQIDKLTIEGDILGPPTTVYFASVDALGTATTGQGIKVIEALGNVDAGDFIQGAVVGAGAYEYSLVAGNVGGLFDGGWYLTSQISLNPPTVVPPPTVPNPNPPTVKPPVLKDKEDHPTTSQQQNYRPLVMSASVLPSLSNYLSLTALGTYQDRVAGSDTTQDGKRSWARSYKGSSDVRFSSGKFETQGANHDRDISGVQVGQDLYRNDTDAYSRHAGVYVGASHVKSRVDGLAGGNVGKVRLDGYNLGVYWTHQEPEGWFVDVNAMTTLYRDAKISSIRGDSLRTDGWGATASLELGYKQGLGDGWFVEPQGQLIYQHVSLENATYESDLNVAYKDSSVLTGRVGTRVGKHLDKAENATAYAHLDLWHTMGAQARTGYSNPGQTTPSTTELSSSMGGGWLQMGAGLNGALTKKTSIYGSVDYQYRVDHSKGNGVMGFLGVKHVW